LKGRANNLLTEKVKKYKTGVVGLALKFAAEIKDVYNKFSCFDRTPKLCQENVSELLISH